MNDERPSETMKFTLAIVVCGPQLEVALAGPSHTAASLVRLAGISPRSTLVLAAADLLVEDAGLEPSAIERVVISRGPGSFTGIRAGVATAQGLAAATGAEIIAFDSLLVQAARCRPAAAVWTAQPGRRGEVYAQSYSIDERAGRNRSPRSRSVAIVGARRSRTMGRLGFPRSR